MDHSYRNSFRRSLNYSNYLLQWYHPDFLVCNRIQHNPDRHYIPYLLQPVKCQNFPVLPRVPVLPDKARSRFSREYWSSAAVGYFEQPHFYCSL